MTDLGLITVGLGLLLLVTLTAFLITRKALAGIQEFREDRHQRFTSRGNKR